MIAEKTSHEWTRISTNQSCVFVPFVARFGSWERGHGQRSTVAHASQSRRSRVRQGGTLPCLLQLELLAAERFLHVRAPVGRGRVLPVGDDHGAGLGVEAECVP